jgi:uncharacterized MnhB-related membrane protein
MKKHKKYFTDLLEMAETAALGLVIIATIYSMVIVAGYYLLGTPESILIEAKILALLGWSFILMKIAAWFKELL